MAKRTRVRWHAKNISLPVIEGSPASASGLSSYGLNVAIRGKKKAGPDGGILRPDFCLIDDPSDDRSAKIHNQNNVREGLIESGLSMLAGPGMSMAMFMACTIIEEGDVASRFLDQDLHPDWRGITVQAMTSMPSDAAMKHWLKYRDLRKQSLKEYGHIELAIQYYVANKDAMNEGAEVYWPERIEPGYPDAVCTIMDVWARAENTFWKEYQQQPQRLKITNRMEPDQRMILRRSSSVPRGVVPDWANRVTAAIDVQGTSLWWLVCAFSNDMRPHVVDHGIFPEQGKLYTTKSQIGRTPKKRPTRRLMLLHGMQDCVSFARRFSILDTHHRLDQSDQLISLQSTRTGNSRPTRSTRSHGNLVAARSCLFMVERERQSSHRSTHSKSKRPRNVVQAGLVSRVFVSNCI